MTTPILNIPEVQSGQVNQYLVYNTALRALEASQNDVIDVDLSSADGSVTLEELRQHWMIVGSGHSVPRAITVPSAKRQFAVHNTGTDTVTVSIGATDVVIPASTSYLLYADGTANGLVRVQ